MMVQSDEQAISLGMAALARKRWVNVTPAQRTKGAKKAAKARNAKLSPERRKEIAAAAGRASQAARRKKV